jgi:hypothetical protein
MTMTVFGLTIALVVIGYVGDYISDKVHGDTVEEFYHGDID